MSLRIAAVQFAPSYCNTVANVHSVVSAIEHTTASIIVFPELATSGYLFTEATALRDVAMPLTHACMEDIQHAAESAHTSVVIGFPELDGEKVYNSAVLYRPNCRPIVYRKTHLFYKENLVFSRGTTGFLVAALPDVDCNVGMMICYDWRFPEAARALALGGADVIVCPSNLVTHIWRTVMPTRAIENKVYLAVANRTGSEQVNGEAVSFNGDSVLYDFAGNILASADATSETIIAADISPEATRNKSFNDYNNIFADRRPDMYQTAQTLK